MMISDAGDELISDPAGISQLNEKDNWQPYLHQVEEWHVASIEASARHHTSSKNTVHKLHKSVLKNGSAINL